ncbi:uncharacterized protein LOC120636634 [Pararge aegeria]|nr:uncharacterized protein LOC120636634 [Pararge aegeria]
MDNNAKSVTQVNNTPEWLKRFLEESEREGNNFALMGSRMLRQKARSIVWYISEKFNCHRNGIPGQACCIVEWYIVYVMRKQSNLEESAIARVVLEYIRPRMLLIMACSIVLAAKMNSAMLPVTATATRTVLALEGFLFSINEVVCMEMEILKALEFRVPLMTSVEVGEMLAHELAVQPQVLPAVTKLIDMAELCRYDVEKVVRWVARSRGLSNCDTRVRTLHLAAGGVAAAVKTASNMIGVSEKLATMLQVPTGYIKCLRDIIVTETAKERPHIDKPLATLQRKRKNNDDDCSRPPSPRPSTSRDPY